HVAIARALLPLPFRMRTTLLFLSTMAGYRSLTSRSAIGRPLTRISACAVAGSLETNRDAAASAAGGFLSRVAFARTPDAGMERSYDGSKNGARRVREPSESMITSAHARHALRCASRNPRAPLSIMLACCNKQLVAHDTLASLSTAPYRVKYKTFSQYI